jgi:hypothetical protein
MFTLAAIAKIAQNTSANLERQVSDFKICHLYMLASIGEYHLSSFKASLASLASLESITIFVCTTCNTHKKIEPENQK